MSFSARKKHFFDKNSNIYPSSPFFTFDVKELFFPMVIFSLNPEGLFGARWRTWWNPPPNIFNLAKNRPFLEEFKKKVFKCDRNHIHKVYVTQIHHDTLFFDPIFAKNIQILAENIHFSFVKIPHFWLFSGVLEVKLKFQDKFYVIFDHNKCPSSEKEDEKCNLRISYFHQIQPSHTEFVFLFVWRSLLPTVTQKPKLTLL